MRFGYGDGDFRLAVDALSIAEGERVACVGPSGTGKTTLVNLIAGIQVPEAGSVRLGDEVVSSLTDAERRRVRIRDVGLVFQEFELLDYLSAYENLLLPYHLTPHLRLDEDVKARASELAGAMGISHTLARRPVGLSHGERQRVAICRALLTEPRLVMCDEPTGNLDSKTAMVTLDLLFAQAERHGATLLMVTHDQGLLHRFDRVIDVEDLQAEWTA
ncbi:MAG: ABC transporter ATP-binding protein [Planctomycetes bacterium]|nr:ABC transporter ATP-binding protein [Planctomycetota bacterium]